jgi:hypothetical protein
VTISIYPNAAPINGLAQNATFLASPNLTLMRPCLNRREERGDGREEEEEEEEEEQPRQVVPPPWSHRCTRPDHGAAAARVPDQ